MYITVCLTDGKCSRIIEIVIIMIRLISIVIVLVASMKFSSAAYAVQYSGDNGIIEIYGKTISRYFKEDYQPSSKEKVIVVRNGMINEWPICYNGVCEKNLINYVDSIYRPKIEQLLWMNNSHNNVKLRQTASPDRMQFLMIDYYLFGNQLVICVEEHRGAEPNRPYMKIDDGDSGRKIFYVYGFSCATKKWDFQYKCTNVNR